MNSMQFSLKQFSLKNSLLFENSLLDSPSNNSPFEISLFENMIPPCFKGESGRIQIKTILKPATQNLHEQGTTVERHSQLPAFDMCAAFSPMRQEPSASWHLHGQH